MSFQIVPKQEPLTINVTDIEPWEKAKSYLCVTLEVGGWKTPGCFREQLNLPSESRMYEKWIDYWLEKGSLMWTWLWSHTTLIECQWSNVQVKKKQNKQAKKPTQQTRERLMPPNIFFHFQITFWSIFVWIKKGTALAPR